MRGNGAGEILLTSMDRDGTRDGFDLALTRAVVDAVDIPVVASGGVGVLQHLVDGALDGGADAVLAASIFHRREFTIGEAKAYMAARGVTRPPRLSVGPLTWKGAFVRYRARWPRRRRRTVRASRAKTPKQDAERGQAADLGALRPRAWCRSRRPTGSGARGPAS